jgi:hypothetical protein
MIGHDTNDTIESENFFLKEDGQRNKPTKKKKKKAPMCTISCKVSTHHNSDEVAILSARTRHCGVQARSVVGGGVTYKVDNGHQGPLEVV